VRSLSETDQLILSRFLGEEAQTPEPADWVPGGGEGE
jgi:hypothetical protein